VSLKKAASRFKRKIEDFSAKGTAPSALGIVVPEMDDGKSGIGD
jgi:hypothetical protein